MMFTNEDTITSLPKGKLLNPLKFILSEVESNTIDKPDYVENKIIKKDMPNLPGNDIGYSVTSKMISENELLITLPYDDNDMTTEERQKILFMEDTDYQINIADDSNTFELEQQAEKGKMPSTNSHDSSPKILSVITLNDSLKEKAATDHDNQNSVITEEINFSDTENESNVKTITILNNVEINTKNDPREIRVRIADLANNSNSNSFVFEKQYQEESRVTDLNKQPKETKSQKKLLSSLKPSVSFTNKKISKPRRTQHGRKSKMTAYKKQTRKTRTVFKASRNILLDVIANPPKECIKQNSVVRTYSHKNKESHNNINEKSTLYQKIQPPPKQEVEKEPDKFAVFDFCDEEEDIKKKEQKLAVLLRERTCTNCNELFKDPMDVLRHKREAHKHRKIQLSREEIEPYLHLENRVHCPLCFKLIHPCGYKSFYVKHLMIHSKNFDFNCKVCGIQFKRKDHMLLHEKRHVVLPEAVK